MPYIKYNVHIQGTLKPKIKSEQRHTDKHTENKRKSALNTHLPFDIRRQACEIITVKDVPKTKTNVMYFIKLLSYRPT